MAIKDFSEKQIRGSILNKIRPVIPKSRSPHQKGLIYLENKVVARVKIPNTHDRIMKSNKSQYIAQSLRLCDHQFNDLVDCPLSGPDYYKKLKERISNQREEINKVKQRTPESLPIKAKRK